jgi:L-gulonolactone oxidase
MKSVSLTREERRGNSAAEPLLGHWSNWETTVQCNAFLAVATSVDDLREIIAFAKRHGKTIRVSGGGEPIDYSGSFSGSPVVQNEQGIIVHVSKINHCLLDRNNTVTAGAGITLQDFDAFALKHGLCLPTNPVPKFIQLGGAVALSCHGSGRDTGTISDQVVSMRILMHDGELRTFTLEADEDQFRAAQVNLGALGIVYEITLQCVPRFKLKATDSFEPMDSTIENVQALVEGHDYVELLWFPFTKNVWVKKWDRQPWDTPNDHPPAPGPTFKEKLGINISNLLTGFAIQFPQFTPTVCNFLASSVSQQTVVAAAPDIFHYASYFPKELYDLSYAIETGRNFEKFQSAWTFAVERVRKIARPTRGDGNSPFCFDYASEGEFPQNSLLHARFLGGSEGLLAPAKGFDSTCMFEAITYVGTPEWDRYYPVIEQHWQSLGGRPHWGKSYSLDAPFAKIYGNNMQKFKAIREELDPGGLFLNDFLRGSVLAPET